jgi:CheY-like chemotaxis protein
MNDAQVTILAFCDDLFFIPRLEDVARTLGYKLKSVEKPSDLGLEIKAQEREIVLTEPLNGPDADLVKHLVTQRPALILVDTACRSVPWRRWVQILKTSAATLRIPIVAFGSHVEKDVLETARKVGADLVVSRGKMQNSLDEIIQTWVVLPDTGSIESSCQDELPQLAVEGINLINSGEYFDAHEVLEEAWLAAEDASRYLLRALLQTSIVYLHIQRKNHPGAAKMLLRVREWLSPLPEICQGVSVSQLHTDLTSIESTLEKDGVEKIPLNALKPITFVR